MIDTTPVILCGGSGTRLWPLSRSGFPKQFICLTGKDSLFQQAAQRLSVLGDHEISVTKPLIVTNEEHRFLATEQLREMGIELGAALLEPEGRNTAPALTLAALIAQQDGKDPVLIVTPADQTVSNSDSFKLAMQSAIRCASQGSFVILGVTPDRPETGYGYIQVKDQTFITSSLDSLPVIRFQEKPNKGTAEQYLKDGGYYWNAGVFVLKASVWLKALQQCRPDIFNATQTAWENRMRDGLFVRPDSAAFKRIPSESIDYAVMEKLTSLDSNFDFNFQIVMVPLVAGWSDLGSWDAVWSELGKDENENVFQGDVIAINSRNSFVNATSRLVSLVGIQDLIVIETPDAVLVTNRGSSQDVKKLIDQLQIEKRVEHSLHRKVHRPWGWYDSIDAGERFKVKRIQVKPGASLSLQSHNFRAEHWIVVKGTAEVTNGEKKIKLTENQSTYIPKGQVHRLANNESESLEIIEVQSGSYLGEDDIVRLVDVYGRK